MSLILGPFFDPGLEAWRSRRPRATCRSLPAASARRRPRRDPLVELALVELARHDRHAPRRGRGPRILVIVEPQLPFPLLGIGTVALEALVGQDRPDVAIELHRFGYGRARAFRPGGRSRRGGDHRGRNPQGKHARELRRGSLYASRGAEAGSCVVALQCVSTAIWPVKRSWSKRVGSSQIGSEHPLLYPAAWTISTKSTDLASRNSGYRPIAPKTTLVDPTMHGTGSLAGWGSGIRYAPRRGTSPP